MEEQESRNWIATTFDTVVKSFGKLIGVIKKNGFKSTLYTLITICLLWSVILYPIKVGDMIEDEVHQKITLQNKLNTEKMEQSITRRENANYFISDIMVNIIDKFHSVNRVLLLEAHNGQHNLKNVDFLYLSCTYEIVNDSISNPVYLYDDLQRQITTNLMGVNFNNTMKHRDFVYFDDLKKQSTNKYRLLKKLSQSGDNQSLIYSFKDKNHRVILLMIISGDNLNADDIEDYISQFKPQINDLLIE